MNVSQRKGRVCWSCVYAVRSAKCLERAYSIVGDACWRCGYAKGKAGRRVLDFHHVDRQHKSFQLDCRHIINLSWARVTEELTKCVLLCANCHRECEAGLIPEQEIRELYEAQWARRVDVLRSSVR